jgi:hypothetical protein
MRCCSSQLNSLLLVLGPIAVSAFTFRHNVDFGYCYDHKVKTLNTSDESDTATQFFLWDRTHSYREQLDHPLLTLVGCERLCNDGYELWPPEDTLLRLVLWIFPATVLIAHFHFAPLPARNICAVVAHLLGDPIDSMWSMLTRQEANRRFYRRATTSGLLNGKPVATIWSACEELGLHDASTYFFDALRARDSQRHSPDHQGISPSQLPSQVPTPGDYGEQTATPPLRQFLRRLTVWDVERAVQVIHFQNGPDDAEFYLIELAAHLLSSNRSESQLTTWVAILGLMGSLIGAYVRTYVNRLNNQTPHTIAVVSLLFIFIPLVKISGNIGAFTSSTVVVEIIQEMRRNLYNYSKSKDRANEQNLFPPLSFNVDVCWDDMGVCTSNNGESKASLEVINVAKWPSMAAWSGMNSSWRPCKLITTRDEYSDNDRGPVVLASLSVLFVLLGSYAPALLLSYMTPLRGFGCRSLAWTLVASSWLVSTGLKFALKQYFPLARDVWKWSIVKDAIVSFLFVGTIIAVQIGFLNSCWCRSGALTGAKESYVSLSPFSDRDWIDGWILWVSVPTAALLIILALIYVVGIDGDTARTLLNRSLSEREADVIDLNNRRNGLQPHDATIVDDMSHAEVPNAGGSGHDSVRLILTSAAGLHPNSQADDATVPLLSEATSSTEADGAPGAHLALQRVATPDNYELQNMSRK